MEQCNTFIFDIFFKDFLLSYILNKLVNTFFYLHSIIQLFGIGVSEYLCDRSLYQRIQIKGIGVAF